MDRLCFLATAILIAVSAMMCNYTHVHATPPATIADTVFDTLHGVVVADPYRWLEDGENPAVRAWTDSQYVYYKDYVNRYPGRKSLESEIRELMHTGAISSPHPYRGRYFWTERAAGEDHPVLYVKAGPGGRSETLLDPNTFSDDNTEALDWYFPSPDGSLMVYGKSHSGTELSTLYLIDTHTRRHHSDTIPYTQFAAIQWEPDSKAFYYTRFPEPGSVPEGDEHYYRRIYRHEIGSDWRDDELVFGQQLQKTDWPWVSASPDGQYLFFGAYTGSQETDIFLRKNDDVRPLNSDSRAYFVPIPYNDQFFIMTNLDAPGYRVMRATYDRPELAYWTEVIPESDRAIQSVQIVGRRLVVHSLRQASSVLDVYSFDGVLERTIDLPSIGSVGSVTGEADGNEMFFLFQSFGIPPTVYRFSLSDGFLEEYNRLDVDIDLSQIEVQLVWYNSKDGTPISMFLVGPRGVKRDGSSPVLLYGYGGFSASQRPFFSKTLTLWFKRGGMFAYPHLRGGGEYGEAWHRAGILENKQNTFDDFVAAAEYLVKEGYTARERLVIEGGSNGGLLIGAVITQRPDICRSAVCSVPLLDMVRYHLFRIARLWIPEYGSAEDSSQFHYIYRYSPYHQIEAGREYPALLLTAAESDTRVDPLHARKFAARLQSVADPETPILLRIETKAGHGQGKPISRQVEETVDKWCFVFKSLGLTPESSN